MPTDPIEIIHSIMTAVSNCALYDKKHTAVEEYSKAALDGMEEIFEEGGKVDFTVLGNNLLFNDERVSHRNVSVWNFILRLRRKGIEKIVLNKGATVDEMKAFIADLVSRSKTPKSSPHLHVGVVELKFKEGEGFDIAGLIDKDVQKVKEAHQGLSTVGKLDIIALEDVVTSFLSALKKEANVLEALSPVKTFSEYTFVHATNVSILSIFQAEALGMKGDMLHEVGIAGMLHDVGKLFVPDELLTKNDRLTSDEWIAMRQHTVMGSTYLAGLKDVPRLAPVVAYEHHLKFDGTGYPDTKRRDRNMHLVSQIVAIADCFDALRTERPYRNALDAPVVVGIIQESAGRDFNPVLVDSFLSALHSAGAV